MYVERIRRLAGPCAVLAALAGSGCGSAGGEATDELEHSPAGADAAADADLAALRDRFAGFTDIEAARAAGYTDQITPCWYHRDHGGQGYHIARSELIDGQVSLLEPELVMYEPNADGSYQFLAVEYIVPFSAWTGTEPPEMLGRRFMRNERLELYVLHVWLGKENPNGLYDDWNPNVSCQHATESEDRAT